MFKLVNIKESEKQEKAKYGDVFFTSSSETPTEVDLLLCFLMKLMNYI